ncbi:hypothetical protein H310_14742 [Aphanomyces invadans]|uniref:Peptidase C1A papain C-terminal domain-containing protein n=1 Tax=Aphanomyces invadans TaxID=157072 RepID=A0A024TB01_9STRA|nr:hypothetical protein H310_14742 [Aphanomyces invadans]ETV90502.1 hypothetical protein H310_14742 [Aphanomyces invadans]|eukprot:XP_008880890.1 hypothetical protein H310_14742 [Aphanomyces invadans]
MQDWANTCPGFQHGGPTGWQNLASNTPCGTNGKDCMKIVGASWMWYDQEETKWNYASNSCNGDWSTCGHFSNMMSPEVKSIACGWSECVNGNYVWCNYNTPVKYPKVPKIAGMSKVELKAMVTQCPGAPSDHAVIAVGYGTSSSDYFKIKNSWGAQWGDNGYIYLQRGVGGKGMCNVAESVSYPELDQEVQDKEAQVQEAQDRRAFHHASAYAYVETTLAVPRYWHHRQGPTDSPDEQDPCRPRSGPRDLGRRLGVQDARLGQHLPRLPARRPHWLAKLGL